MNKAPSKSRAETFRDEFTRPVGTMFLRIPLRGGATGGYKEVNYSLQDIYKAIRNSGMEDATVEDMNSTLSPEPATKRRTVATVCMYCESVRESDGVWTARTFDATEQTKSHGICPDCLKNIVIPELIESGVPDPFGYVSTGKIQLV